MRFSGQAEKCRQEFIGDWVVQSVIRAAFSHNPTYNEKTSPEDKGKLKDWVKEYLKTYSDSIKNNSSLLNFEKHFQTIENFAGEITDEFGKILFGKKFRIGTSQKIINLFLKYQWILENIKEQPPHCPFDGIIIRELIKWLKGHPDHINLLCREWENWTKIEDISTYRKLVHTAKIAANLDSLSNWELICYQKATGN